MQKRFSVTAYLSTPLVTGGGYMTLDALLAARLFDDLQNVEAAHAAVPIAHTGLLAHASGAIYESHSVDRVTFVAQLRAQHAINPDLIQKNKHGQLHRKFDTSLTNVMNNYTVITTPAVTWYAEGDLAEVRRLLEPVAFIGKRRAAGFGRVGRWGFDDADLDGITGYAGEPMRPVPIDMFTGNGGVVVDAAWKLPYWSVHNRAACYVPPGVIRA